MYAYGQCEVVATVPVLTPVMAQLFTAAGVACQNFEDYRCCDYGMMFLRLSQYIALQMLTFQVPRPLPKPLGKAAHVVKKMLHYCKRLAERSPTQRMQEVMTVTEAAGHHLILYME